MIPAQNLEHLVRKNTQPSPGRMAYFDNNHPPYQQQTDQTPPDFYPSPFMAKDGVILRKVNPYTMGSADILGMVNTYSGRGMILEGITGEEAEKVLDHETFHANQRPNNEETTRRCTHTEEPHLNPYTCALNS